MNTKNALEIAKVSSLLAFVFLCVSLGITSLRLGTTIKKANGTLDQASSTLLTIHKLTNDARLTLDNVNRAAIDERFYFEKEMPGIVGNVQNVLNDTHRLLVSANDATQSLNASQVKVTQASVAVLDTTRETIGHVDLVLGQADVDLANLEVAEKDLDKVINSPDIVGTLHNINETTASGSRTMSDIETEVHKITHPKPVIVVINWTLKVAHAVGAWF